MPEKGTPEYDWLYGSRSSTPPSDATQRVPASQAGPEETRVMPVARREERRDARGSGGQPPAAGRTPAAAPPPQPKKRRWRPRLRLIPLLLLLILVYLVGVPLYHWTKIDKVDAAPNGARPDSQPGTTYLLVGSDSRKGLSKSEKRRLSA